MKFIKNSSKIIAWMFLSIIIITSTIGMVLEKTQLITLGVITIGIPITLASLLAIIYPHLLEEYDYPVYEYLKWRHISFLNCIFLFTTLYFVSLYILLSNSTRTLGYFVLISLMGILLFFESTSFCYSRAYNRCIILAQIILLFFNITLGHTLRVPMVTYTDIFYHMAIIEKLVNSGFVSSEMGMYEYFPLFHIFNTIGSVLTNMGIKSSYFILSAFIFSASVLLVYLIIFNATKNINISLVSTLVYIFCPPVIDSGISFLTRTAAYVMCLFAFYLSMAENTKSKKTVGLFFIIPLVLIHQSTLVGFTVILIFFVIASKILINRLLFKISYIFLFLSSYIAYWIYRANPFFISVITNFVSSTEEVAVKATPSLILNYSYFLNNIDYVLIVFLIILGLIYSLKHYDKMDDKCYVYSVASLFFFPIFLPGIAGLFSSLLGYRWPILVSPFIAFITSIGLLSLLQICNRKNISKVNIYVIIIFLFAFFFFSSILSGKEDNYTSLPDPFGEKDRDYFKKSELESFQFIRSNGIKQNTVFSDYIAYRYLSGYIGLKSSSSMFITTNSSLSHAYFIFRKDEYISKGKLYFSEGQKNKRFHVLQQPLILDQYPYLQNNLSKSTKIYSGRTVDIYMKNSVLINT